MKFIKKEEMARVDKLAVSWGLEIQQMMENAGANVARFVSRMSPGKIVCLYGKGNNGGDAMCAARHLSIMGLDVSIVGAGGGNKEVKHQLKILNRMGVRPVGRIGKLVRRDVIIDGLLGYNIDGNPRGRYAGLIEDANSSGARIVSYDIPSGMNPDSGKFYSPCINADYTLTLALPKVGLRKGRVGKLYLVNIGIPNEVFFKLGIKIRNYFKRGDVVKV